LASRPTTHEYRDPTANLAAEPHHWLGTDNFGRDPLSLVLEASLSPRDAVLATLIAGVLARSAGSPRLLAATSTLIARRHLAIPATCSRSRS
jgi:ABC-type dipeptide/oligopeptide/nickel transport system permease subunit